MTPEQICNASQIRLTSSVSNGFFPLIFRFIVFLDIPISSASERWLYPFNTISDISSLLFTIRLLSPTFPSLFWDN